MVLEDIKYFLHRGLIHTIPLLKGVSTIDEFVIDIEFERARSHRTGECFCLVVFDCDNEVRNSKFIISLVQFLRKRARSIDRIGWFDKNRIGILLPDTSPEGAQKLGEHVTEAIRQLNLTVFYKIYPFPSNWLVTLIKNKSEEMTFDYKTSLNNGVKDIEKHRTNSRMNLFESDMIAFYRTLPLWKRSIDIFFSLFGLFFLSPMFVFVGTYIKLVSPGPIFFKQQRVGFDGKPFTFWKFRTMHPNGSEQVHREYLARLINASTGDDNSGPAMSKLDNDSRIIPGGLLLRKTCIDELPQLINVFLGEMSLVGPRPPIPYEVSEYLKWHNGRFDVVPGMTGLWQVSGKNRLSFKEMVRLDIRYAREFNFWLDLKILFKTPMAIIRQLIDSIKNQNLSVKGAK